MKQQNSYGQKNYNPNQIQGANGSYSMQESGSQAMRQGETLEYVPVNRRKNTLKNLALVALAAALALSLWVNLKPKADPQAPVKPDAGTEQVQPQPDPEPDNVGVIPEEDREERIVLTSLEPMTKQDVSVNSSKKDVYGNEYTSTLAGKGIREPDYIEYHLDGKYTTLTGVRYVSSDAKEDAVQDESCMVSIYGDDKLIYQRTGATYKDEAETFSIDVTGVKFLRVEFLENYCYYNTFCNPLVYLGNLEVSN